ncbi:MAG: putative peptidase M15 [Prokaryotic dsDNA virus sp.]|nr:MAG: putative peptidase M15 [Prokaryotic dsDNA virus sp.]
MEQLNWDKYSPLYPHEFDSPDEVGSHKNMKPSFMQKLKEARDISSTPFIINSGHRTREHNRRVGGKADSSHLDGFACDIACSNSRQRAIILSSVIRAGFNRIGIGDTFIHVDNDPSKPKNVFWMY